MNKAEIDALRCPKCGAELEDLWDGEPVSTFIGEWSEDRFRCCGLEKPAKDDRFGAYHWVNRTESCGYFGLEDLGFVYTEEE